MTQGYPNRIDVTDSPVEEVALLQRVAQRDRVAFEALYRCYFARLRRFIQKMTRLPHLDDEILDDTMLVVWQKAHTFDNSCRVSTWIFAVAYRTTLKALSRERRHMAADGGEAMGQAGDGAAADIVCDEPGPDSMLFTVQSRRVLDRLLTKLPAEHRAVIELTYFHGHAYGDIATIVDCPEGTVKTRMFHARRKLRELLLKEGWRSA